MGAGSGLEGLIDIAVLTGIALSAPEQQVTTCMNSTVAEVARRGVKAEYASG